MTTLYITGAGVSAESGIPTFRGADGYWTIGSRNYTPQQMATRAMYEQYPEQFLSWYYKRFVTYRHHGPNSVHEWLKDKCLITQNIDGLDGKAGNQDYIAIHGRIDQVVPFEPQSEDYRLTPVDAPWHEVDESHLVESLLALFKIGKSGPQYGVSLKPYVLLFDEYYSELFHMEQAIERIQQASKMVFMGTSFSVNITQIALDIARRLATPIEIVDPSPVPIVYPDVTYHQCTASEFVNTQS